MNGWEALADILRREGVDYLFCFPSNPLIDAAAQAGIRPILARTERTVIGMADGYSRHTNGELIGVCCVQAGPGTENMFSGVAQAYGDSVPILVLPGQAGRNRIAVAPNFEAVPNYGGVTKWLAQINLVDRIPELMRRAFMQLRTGRPGPVLLETPTDVMQEEFGAPPSDYQPVRGTRSAADPDDVAAAVEALLAADKPVLHVGQGVLWARAWDELREFAELVQAPVATTLAGKSAFPEDHPLAAGMLANTSAEPASQLLNEADLVFGIGASFSKAPLSTPIPAGKVLVQQTIDPADLNREYTVDHTLLGDAKLVLRQLSAAVKEQLGPEGRQAQSETAAEVGRLREAWIAKWQPHLTSDDVPLSSYRVIWDLMHSVDRTQTIITHDSGNPRDAIAPFWQPVIPRGYLGWGKSTQLGYGLSLVMGAKLAAPEKLAIHFLGDGAFGMCGMDYETAVRERIPILAVLINNSALGGYEKSMPYATEKYRSKYLSGDYAAVAKGLGAYSERVEQPTDIKPAIQRALSAIADGKPALLECITHEEYSFSGQGG
ncbi:MAG: hypothetical protein CL878_07360 [Dehalococcoidia bacterium]|nr:hypothetical protein [Dehalococcoidia bacterium]